LSNTSLDAKNKIKEWMKSGGRQGARPRRSLAKLGYGEVEQRRMAPDFGANYRANF